MAKKAQKISTKIVAKKKAASAKSPQKTVAAKPKNTLAPVPKKSAKSATTLVKKKNVPKKIAKPVPTSVKKSAKKVAPKQTNKNLKPQSIKTATPKAIAPKKLSAKTAPVKPVASLPQQGAPKGIDLKNATFPGLQNHRPIAYLRPVKKVEGAIEKTRYTDEELKEFEKLILSKLEIVREEFRLLKETLNRSNDRGTDSTGANSKVLEDGAETAEKENLSHLAARQQKFIQNMEMALLRIKNKTYGICSVTGKLIPKERLIAVPHTTQSIEAKMRKQD